MLPSNSGFLSQDFVIEEQTSRTYAMDIDKKTIRGFADKLDAMKQAVYKILMTERYKYIIYSQNYGVELDDLIGEPLSFVMPEIKRRIAEALLWDNRITAVDNFTFETTRRAVHTTFKVHTIYGDFIAERTVNF